MPTVEAAELRVSRFKGSVTPRSIDEAWTRNVGSDDARGRIVIDLQRVSLIDNSALLYMLAVAADRWTAGLELAFDLPNTDSTRLQYLRGWGFVDAVEIVAGNHLVEPWTPRSNSILATARSRRPRFVRVVEDPNGGFETLMSEDFFAVTPLILERGDGLIANMEKSRWLNDKVVGVLDRQIRATSAYRTSPGQVFATGVVYEAVLNAARHPMANMAFITSQIQRLGSGPDTLTFSIWDDGRSIYQTLDSAIGAGKRVAAKIPSGEDELLHIVFRDDQVPSRSVRETIRASNWRSASTPATLMVGAFLTGVTSLADLRGNSAAFENTGAGQGLSILKTIATRELGGVIEYRTGHYRMSIAHHPSAGEPVPAFNVRIERLQVASPSLKGNLLTVTVPIR